MMVCDMLHAVYSDVLQYVTSEEIPVRMRDMLDLVQRKDKHVPAESSLRNVSSRGRNVGCWHCGENHFSYKCLTPGNCDNCERNDHTTAYCTDYYAFKAERTKTNKIKAHIAIRKSKQARKNKKKHRR